MQRLFSSFPAGSAGAGLLLLRFCVAESLLITTFGELAPNWYYTLPVEAGAVFIAAAIVFGAWTPVSCGVSMTMHVILTLTSARPSPLQSAFNILLALALALLGPGAYSADARRFGRKVIVLPE